MGNGRIERELKRRAARVLQGDGWPVRDVALVLGVHRDTIYGWQRDPDQDARLVRRDAGELAEALLRDS